MSPGTGSCSGKSRHLSTVTRGIWRAHHFEQHRTVHRYSDVVGTDRFILGPPELVTARFAVAPGNEGARAVRRLTSRKPAPLHRALIDRLRRDVPAAALDVLALLAGARGYTPDFLVQPEVTTPADLLAATRTAPLEIVDTELRRTAHDGRDLPDRWLEEPEHARTQIANAWDLFWARGMAAHWPRIREVLEADIAARAHLLAREGLETVVEDLDPRLTWCEGTVLRADSRFALTTDCRGRGLRLVPTVLGWPRGAITTELPWTPTIYYPARNASAAPTDHATARAAARLIGTTRARILDHLRVPARTIDVAAALGISPATASHHLHILGDAGLISTQRRGKESWHARTITVDDLGW